MPVASRIEEVRNEISELAERSANADDLMRKMVNLLRKRMLKYNWAGFYMLEPGTQPPVLVLGAFDGVVFVHGKIAGELDIDSHFPAAFTAEDKTLVQHGAALVGLKLEASSE